MLTRLVLFTVLVCSLSIGFIACSEEVEYDDTTVYLDPPESEPASELSLIHISEPTRPY